MVRLGILFRVLSVLVLGAPALPGAVRGQTDFVDVPVWLSEQRDLTQSVAVGDVDGDGDLDLVCGNNGQPATLYRNLGSSFELLPSWSSSAQQTTEAVALGDVDGDGDLDLVCGNDGQPTTLYRNLGSSFESVPSWFSRSDATQSVALGDVDGDGDLDLVCGNVGQPTKLFRNLGNVFATAPDWWTDQAFRTESVGLADVDGDGDLDLVCGNFGQSAMLYRNLGTSFEGRPSWVSTLQHPTQSVALGDVDGDGDLDLVCGNDVQRTMLYRNLGSGFTLMPDWLSSRLDPTKSVALADVDGDGGLDLICGNRDQSTALYRNDGVAFEEDPHWSSQSHATQSVALADMEGDGDLDLVCGNWEQGTALYKNTGDRFEIVPSWVSAVQPTRNVALGDVDADGDLDLVCGNFNQPTTLYRNAGATFDLLPSWQSPSHATRSVALGDVDADGDLDLVCGNFDQPTVLYRNSNATFDTLPPWRSPQQPTQSVALGDVDGDGRLDLVCGNLGQSTTLYRNTGSEFTSLPTWASRRTDRTQCVALGDVDADGDLDLVCGNNTQASTLYLNHGGVLDLQPAWSSEPQDATQSVALGDVDGDGDLDLVLGNFGGSATFYRNVGGASVFETQPTWISGPSQLTLSVALGDVDRDGDPDLVCGNENQSTTLYAAWARPPFRGDPSRPTHHLPNHDAYLRRVSVEPNGVNTYRVRLSAYDVESDPAWVLADFAPRGSTSWTAVTLGAGGVKLGPLPASPAGVEHEFDWNVLPVPLDAGPIVLRLRTLSPPRRVGVIQLVSVYLHEVGPVRVLRPELSTSAAALALPAVTVGDTVTTTLAVSNSGNEPLHIAAITPPLEATASPSPPHDLAPGESLDLHLVHHPVHELAPLDTLRITSNDPLRPELRLPVTKDVRTLQVQTRPLAVAPAPLGQAIPVQAIPIDSLTAIEHARLFYRPRGRAEFDTTAMAQFGRAWVGIIPGDAVRELGVEYYLEIENHPALALDPLGGAATPYAITEVKAPAGIAVRALPTSRSGFLEGRDIRVEVALPEGADFLRGNLHYRSGGESVTLAESLAAQRPQIATGTIPGPAVGPRGLEYWVEVQTQTKVLFHPAVQPAEHPDTLRVSVALLEEPSEHPAARYRLLSIPLDFGDQFSGTLLNLLLDEPEFGAYDNTRWRAFRYLPGLDNVELMGDARFRPEPGRAFWLVTRSTHRIDTAPEEGLSVPTHQPFAILLEPGWNQIGNPFAFPVARSSLEFPAAVESLTAFDPNLGTTGDYSERPVRILEPFAGYFVYNAAGGSETLRVSPVAAPQFLLARSAAGAAGDATRAADVPTGATGPPWYDPAAATGPDSWAIRLLARSAGALDGTNVFGVHPNASDTRDGLDAREPPPAPGSWVQLGFAHDNWTDRPGLYRHDLRAPGAEGQAWEIEVRSAAPLEEVEISLAAMARAAVRQPPDEDPASVLPPTWHLLLVDRELDLSISLYAPGAPIASHRLLSYGASRAYRLTLLAGTPEYVARMQLDLVALPGRELLDQNAPNPFNAATRIRLGLPRAEAVHLRVFDVRGQLVASLVDRRLPAGYHQVIWGGEDARGRPVASGIYLLQMGAGDVALSRRMVLLK